jgi:curved DNA-binding protein
MEFRDYYEVMGVARDATQDEVKRAYRKLARKYHPDVSTDPNAEDQFKEVGEAYEVLKDPEKRVSYDQLGADWKRGQDFRPPPDWKEGFEYSGEGDGDFGRANFSDFFESLFGQGQPGGDRHAGQQLHRRGEDRHARVTIDFRDSYTGVQRQIALHVPQVTEDGHVVTQEKTLNIKIPQGILDGQKIRLAGQGASGLGEGKSGDLFLDIEFRPDKHYWVEGADVYLNLPVTPWEAALGATVTVPIPSGNVDLKIPADSGQGSKLRLKGKGIPAKQPGNFYVVLDVHLPPADNDAARELYKKMSQEMAFNPRADL